MKTNIQLLLDWDNTLQIVYRVSDCCLTPNEVMMMSTLLDQRAELEFYSGDTAVHG